MSSETTRGPAVAGVAAPKTGAAELAAARVAAAETVARVCRHPRKPPRKTAPDPLIHKNASRPHDARNPLRVVGVSHFGYSPAARSCGTLCALRKALQVKGLGAFFYFIAPFCRKMVPSFPDYAYGDGDDYLRYPLRPAHAGLGRLCAHRQRPRPQAGALRHLSGGAARAAMLLGAEIPRALGRSRCRLRSQWR